MRHRGTIRLGLVALGLSQLLIGLWAIVDTSGWFGSFPGPFASDWLPAYGPYNDHLALDAGAFFAATGVMLILAAVWMGHRLVQAALISYLVFQIPHTVFHLGADDVLPMGDRVVSNVALVSTIVVAGLLLWLASDRRRPQATPVRAQGNGAARIAPRTKGMLARFGAWYARREYGNEVTPGGVFAHHPKLAMGYGGFELALDRSDTVPAKLKALGEIKAATVVNCEWCMDFGSMIGREHGVSDEQLREMPRHRESPAFDELERLVLDYATAMSRSPAEVDDELFARLREHFDDTQLVELTSAIAIENFRARFNHATGMAAQGFSEGMVCVVPERVAEVPAQQS